MVSMSAILSKTVRPLAFAAALAALPSASWSQQYPSQDIHFICAFPAGSGADIVVRWFAEKVRIASNRTVIVDNKAGAGGNIATEFTARAKPDGYTIYVHAGSGIAANMHLFKNPSVDAAKARQVAATINKQPFMLVVDPSKPWKTTQELTAYLKQKGDKATYATSNPPGVVMGALYKTIVGLNPVEVSYRTAQDALPDFASGQIDFGALDPQFASTQAKAGKLRILAVSSAQRMSSAPDIPTMIEGGAPGLDMMGWFSVQVPSATPKPIVTQINTWFNDILRTPDAEKFLAQFGSDVFISTPEQAQALFEKEIKAWGEYVKVAKIEPQG